jgi:carbon starvation protein CstA
LLTQTDFSVVWRYFAWANQTLATIVLWTITVYLVISGKNFWITLLPAVFMTSVISVYILLAPEGLNLPAEISYPAGFFVTVISVIIFIVFYRRSRN